MIKEFKQFIARGNVIDMAVGIIIGLAFGKIITSFVNDILMPPIGLLLGKMNFSDMFINLSGTPYATLAEAQKAGAATINYGLFINTIVDFILIAFAVFLVVKWVNKLRGPVPTPKDCPYCLTKIPAAATRCPACTSEVEAA